MKLLASALSALVLMGLNAPQALAKSVDLSVDLGTPEVLAGEIQKVYLKVSLNGLERGLEVERIPANVALVLDRSGSMEGDKMVNTREAARTAINMLGAEDIVSIVTYNHNVEVLVPATKLNDPSSVNRAIGRIQAGGRTALFAGVSKGASETRKFLDDGYVNRVILLSDGLANVGPSSPGVLGRLGGSLAKEGISVTTIGLGLDYNEDLMATLAGQSDGNHVFAEDWSELAKIFRQEFDDVLAVVAQDVNIHIKLENGARPVRVIGRQAEINGNDVHLRLNQIYSEQEKFVLLEVEIPSGQSGDSMNLASVNVQYTDAVNGSRETASSSTSVMYVDSVAAVEEATDKDLFEDAVRLEVNGFSKEAVQLRDQGNIAEARSVLDRASRFVQDQQSNIGASALSDIQMGLEIEVDAITDDTGWNANRKRLIEQQFNLDNQKRQ